MGLADKVKERIWDITDGVRRANVLAAESRTKAVCDLFVYEGRLDQDLQEVNQLTLLDGTPLRVRKTKGSEPSDLGVLTWQILAGAEKVASVRLEVLHKNRCLYVESQELPYVEDTLYVVVETGYVGNVSHSKYDVALTVVHDEILRRITRDIQ